MLLVHEVKWIIMSKDRKVIATGIPRHRRLSLTEGNKNRIIFYNNKKKAECAFIHNGFFGEDLLLTPEEKVSENRLSGPALRADRLEAVEVHMKLETTE